MAVRYVLIDTDCGTDDAMAIAMTIRAHQDDNIPLKVIGIVCVNGNTKLDNVCINVTRLLDTLNASDIPIYKGCNQPIIYPHEHKGEPFHGKDGFGDVYASIKPRLEVEHGVSAIINYAKKYKGNLTILTLGPMTNLAIAVRTEPTIVNCVKEIYAMGGNIEGVGNTTVSAEFNFCVDPEAAYITLSTFIESKIFIVPWEVCLRQGTQSLSWRVDTFKELGTASAVLLNKIESKIFEMTNEKKIWIPCDQLAAAAMINEEIMVKVIQHYCTVELQGNHTRGLMIVDYPSLLDKPHNVNLVTEIDQDLLRKMLIWSAGGQHYNA